MFKNAAGMYCYRYAPKEQWVLYHDFTPDTDQAFAFVAAPKGPLPIGAKSWGCVVGGRWEDRKLTVAAMHAGRGAPPTPPGGTAAS